MRRRLLVSTALIVMVAIVILGVPAGFLGTRLAARSATDRLDHEADRVAVAVSGRLAAGGNVSRQELARLASPSDRVIVRLTSGATITSGPRLVGEALRVYADGTSGARITVEAPEGEVDERTGAVWLAVGLLSAGALAGALALALFQGRRLARPLERLAQRSHLLEAPNHPVHGHTRTGVGEIDELANALDAAAARLSRLIAREREFSANASHQLRTPLTALRMRLEELEHLASGDVEIAAEARAALAAADRLLQVIVAIESLAREGRAGPARTTDLSELLTRQLEAWRGRFKATGRRLEADLGRDLRAHLNPEAMRQALDVVLDNALRHGAGTTVVRAGEADELVHVSIADEGVGIPAELADRIFDRRVSLRRGSGLGLAVARELLTPGGAELRLANLSPPRFEFLIPRAPASAGLS
ncbi:MAG: ATP-binding protein [Solirubrobacteraceae bacterium]